MKSFEEAKNLISKDDFISYFRRHSNVKTAEHFEVTTTTVVKLCQLYEFKKSKEDIALTKEATCLERYGVKNPYQTDFVKDRCKKSDEEKQAIVKKCKETLQAKAAVQGLTLSELYSKQNKQGYKTKVDNYGSQDAFRAHIRESINNTLINNYGSLEEAREAQKIAREQTCLEKYGSKNVFSSNEIKDKIQAHHLETYGNRCPIANKDILEKANKTRSDKYGSLEQARKISSDKAKETKLELYGSETYVNSEKRKLTCLEKYGVECSLQNPEVRSKQAKSAKESALEKRLKEFLVNNRVDFDSHVTFKKDNLVHEFDVAIYKDNDLKILVDCDGLYYHGFLSDVNGKTVNSYSDNYRQMLVPEGVKYLVCLEKYEDEAYSEILKLIDIDYNQYLLDVFNWCREVEFPYPSYSEDIVKDSYNSLVKSDVNKFNVRARFGEKAILDAHKSVWHANKQGFLSPYDAWQDDELLKKLIKNRVIYKGCNLDRSKVLYGLSAAYIAPRVSIFNPYLAKYLVSKYLNEFNIVFDPCSGYSGRMLGVCSLCKYYIGQDVNNITIDESDSLVDRLNLDARVSCKDSLNDIGIYDCLFTCPPYNLKETWNQSIENKSCDEWIDIFIKNYRCKKYLFVVDKTEKYKDYIVEEIENKSHFSKNVEYVVLINRGDI